MTFAEGVRLGLYAFFTSGLFLPIAILARISYGSI